MLIPQTDILHTVNYFSPATSTAIIRCPRDHYELVWAALTFVTKLQDTLETGIGNLVDADIAKESAKLQALQVQQQLGAQALSIANSQPQVILQLFRGG